MCNKINEWFERTPKKLHENFDYAMITNGFKIIECDKCINIKEIRNTFIILFLYVDIPIVVSNEKLVKTAKSMMNSEFDMKYVRLNNVILGIKIISETDGPILSRTHYVDKILEKFKMNDSGVTRTSFIIVSIYPRIMVRYISSRILEDYLDSNVSNELY